MAKLDFVASGQLGTTVVFLHGLGASLRQFEADVEYFGTQRRAIALSLRGHGQSFRPDPATAEAYTVATMADDVAESLDDLGVDRADLVGNSMGGLVVYALLRRYPELVRSIVTFGTTAELHSSAVIKAAVVWSARLLGPSLMGSLARRTASKVDGVGDLVGEMMSTASRDALVGCANAIADYDELPLLRETHTPYLLLQGELDRDINKTLQSTLDVLASRPNSVVEPVEGAGHFVNLDQAVSFRDSLAAFHAQLTD